MDGYFMLYSEKLDFVNPSQGISNYLYTLKVRYRNQEHDSAQGGDSERYQGLI